MPIGEHTFEATVIVIWTGPFRPSDYSYPLVQYATVPYAHFTMATLDQGFHTQAAKILLVYVS